MRYVDPVRNPYAPGAGQRPPELAGRDRELEVFQIIGAGKGTREVAAQLHLSVKTVEVHRAHIKEKLALKTAPELVRCAVR